MAEKALQTIFETVAKAGKISLDGFIKLLKDVGIIGKDTGITEADGEAAFKKICKDKKEMDFAGIKECINALAKEKKIDPKELLGKITTGGPIQGTVDAGAKVTKDATGK